MENTTQPANYSPLPTSPEAASGQQTGVNNSRKILVTVLVALAVVVLGLVGFMIVQNSAGTSKESQPIPTIAPTAAPATDEVSQDDTVDIMEKEVESTTLEDFEQENQSIQNDTNQL